jgi:hypothetical protein
MQSSNLLALRGLAILAVGATVASTAHAQRGRANPRPLPVAVTLNLPASAPRATQTAEYAVGPGTVRLDSVSLPPAFRVLRGPLPAIWSKLNIVVSLKDRSLTAVVGRDTVYSAPVGVANGLTLAYAGRSWKFQTPKGGRRVLRKMIGPVWTPPDWHYAEAARAHGLKMVRLTKDGTRLKNGMRLVIRDKAVGVILPDGDYAELPTDEHVIFGDLLFIPPVGTRNRQVSNALGSVALDLGNGYLIHGTSNSASVGRASSHGCLRMHEEDLMWLFEHVPVGSRVTIR